MRKLKIVLGMIPATKREHESVKKSRNIIVRLIAKTAY